MHQQYDTTESGFYVVNKPVTRSLSNYYNSRYKNNFPVGSLSKKDRSYYKCVLEKALYKKRYRVLDVACGTGKYCEIFPNMQDYYGVDFSAEAVGIASKTYGKANFFCCSADTMPFKDAIFDFLICIGSLEHFPSMGKALIEMRRVLKLNGKLYLELPNLFFLGYFCRYVVMKKSPWSGQPFERLGGIDSYLDLLKENGFSCLYYSGRNYARKTRNPVVYILWNLGSYFLPNHVRENHCFLLEKIK